ncbi:MAG: glycosyltransferase involved in cell wall biosynthesis [Granulosicoccus sp.]
MINVTMLVFNSVYKDSRVLKEAESLSKNDCAVTIVGLDDGQETPTLELPFNIVLISVKSRKYRSKTLLPLKFMELIYRNYKLLMSQDIDVVHCHDIGPMIVAWLISARKKIPVVYDSHELEYDRNTPSKTLKLFNRYYEKLFIGKASQIIVSDGDFRANVMRDVHNIRAPMTYVRNCPPTVIDSKIHAIDIKEKLGISKDSKIVLYVGHVIPGRGAIQTLESLLHLPKEVVLLIVGTVRDNGKFQNTIDKLKLNERVFNIGPYPYKELVKYTVSADVGLCLIENTCLSYYHSTPTKLFDYIAAGVPALVSNFPAMNEIVQNTPEGEIGISVNPDDPVEIANGIKMILGWDNEKRIAVKERMYNLHHSQYNWDSQEENLLSVYNKYR